MNNELNLYIENSTGDFSVKKVVVEANKLLGFDVSLNPVMLTDQQGAGGSSTILSSQTLTAASWALTSGLYQYTFSNAGILSTSIITVTPVNASIDIVIASQMLPYITVSTGSIIMYAKYLPSANITVDIGIEA